jgi:hypothetical protein
MHWSKVDIALKPDHPCPTVLVDVQEEKQRLICLFGNLFPCPKKQAENRHSKN